MLSSHYENLLLEYRQDKTAEKMGVALADRLMADVGNNPDILDATTALRIQEIEASKDPKHPLSKEWNENDKMTPEAIEALVAKAYDFLAIKVLNTLEKTDPTKKKEYVQWLARIYIKDAMSIEDIQSTIADYLEKFHKLKIKRHLSNADIGQFKSFSLFMNELDTFSNDLLDVEDDELSPKRDYTKLYDEDNILVIHPKTKAAAMKYGRGTRWCTAATRGQNYFTHYNKQGPLSIFIPRRPDHPGEKYQFHKNGHGIVVADEKDDYLNQLEQINLVDRYPGLKKALKDQAAEAGAIWLQEPIETSTGDGFTLDEYRKDSQPFYIIKSTADPSEVYTVVQGTKGYPTIMALDINGRGNTLNLIQQRNFLKKYPELVTRFGGDSIEEFDPIDNVGDFEVEQIKGGYVVTDTNPLEDADLEADDSKDPTATRRISENQYGISVNIQEEREEGRRFRLPIDPFTIIGTRQSDHTHEPANPYEFTRRIPGMVEFLEPKVKELLDKSLDSISKLKPSEIGSGKGAAEEKAALVQKAYVDLAWAMPYKIYDNPKTAINSHVTYEGKPLVDYIISKINTDYIYTVEHDLVEDTKPNINSIKMYRLKDTATYEKSEDERLMFNVSNLDNLKDNSGKAMDTLASISFLKAHPELKKMYAGTSLVDPVVTETENVQIEDYGLQRNADYRGGDSDNPWYPTTWRNFVLDSKDVPGLQYSITWPIENPGLTQVQRINTEGTGLLVDDHHRIQSILKLVPEIKTLLKKDFKKQLEATGEDAAPNRDRTGRGGGNPYHGNYHTKSILPDNLLIDPTEVYEDATVQIDQFGPYGGPFSLPRFVVTPKTENPFGSVGDTFYIDMQTKDRRGKAGKIASIVIRRMAKAVYRHEDGNGNPFADELDNPGTFVEDSIDLPAKHVIDFFKAYPGLRRMVKDENVHATVPHPALAVKADDIEAAKEGVRDFPAFTMEDVPGVKGSYYVIPKEETFNDEYYTIQVQQEDDELPKQYGNGIRIPTIQLFSGESREMLAKLSGTYGSNRGRSRSVKIPTNTEEFNAILARFPELLPFLIDLAKEEGSLTLQNPENVTEIGIHRVYEFTNADKSKQYVVTPIGNPVRPAVGQIDSEQDAETQRAYRGSNGDDGNMIPSETWNRNSITINFESTQDNMDQFVELNTLPDIKELASLVEKIPYEEAKQKHMNAVDEFTRTSTNFVDEYRRSHNGFRTVDHASPEILRIRGDAPLKKYFEDLAEARNAETKGIGDFINFLPDTTNLGSLPASITVFDLPILTITKLGIANPIIFYLYHVRQSLQALSDLDPKALKAMAIKLGADEKEIEDIDWSTSDTIARSRYSHTLNQKFMAAGFGKVFSEGWNDGMRASIGRELTDQHMMAFKPESGTYFEGRGNSPNILVQTNSLVEPFLYNRLPGLKEQMSPKKAKENGLAPASVWKPQADTPKPNLQNDGKRWIKNIEKFNMPNGFTLISGRGYYRAQATHTRLAPGTLYKINLNPIEHDAAMGASQSLMQLGKNYRDLRYKLFNKSQSNFFYMYFVNNKTAIIIDDQGQKMPLSTKDKEALFFGIPRRGPDGEDVRTLGLMPEIRSAFDEYKKSNKWMREAYAHQHHLNRFLVESFDNLTWTIQTENNNNYNKLHFLKPGELRGSYSDSQLISLGFKKSNNGHFYIPQTKWDTLINTGKLKEMTLRPLKTGKAKIAQTGSKKIAEEDDDDTLTLPKIKVGDEVKVGKFKNRKAEVTGFAKDENNHPLLKTTKGEQQVFKPRFSKLMKEEDDAVIEEGKKFPRTSEFLHVRELDDIKRLAGVYDPYVDEGDSSMGSNISKTSSKIAQTMRDKKIQPGTPEWFQLWFSKPYLTGEKPTGDEE